MRTYCRTLLNVPGIVNQLFSIYSKTGHFTFKGFRWTWVLENGQLVHGRAPSRSQRTEVLVPLSQTLAVGTFPLQAIHVFPYCKMGYLNKGRHCVQ